jgi:glycosyltransferase involved in cell wall biosynthesis
VVTPDPSVWRHVEDPQKVAEELEREGIRRVLTDHRWRWLSEEHLNRWNENLGWVAGGICRSLARYVGIEGEIGWVEPSRQACSTFTGDDVDVIFATGSPFVAFSLAKWLSDKLRRPYVLDYRDLWTQNPHADALTLSAKLRFRREAELLADCAAATVVSRSCGSALAQRFDVGAKTHVVTNGYDPEKLADVERYDFGHFAIVYTGSFYPPKRVITPVMAALKRFRETANDHNTEWYFHYYGDWGAHVHEEADRFGVMDRVVLHGRVSQTEALSAVRGAGVAVVITSVFEAVSVEDKGIVTAKVFEALGLGTPILLIAPSGSDAREILDETDIGRSFSGTDIDGIVGFLLNSPCTRHKTSNCGNKYSWPTLSVKLDTILRSVLATGPIADSQISTPT